MYRNLNKKNIVIAVTIVLGFLGLIIIPSILSIASQKPEDSSLDIKKDDFYKCVNSRNADKIFLDTINSGMYKYIERANKINSKETDKTYSAEFRKDSCKELDSTSSIKNNEAIIDIPDAGQSWLITFTWTNGKNSAMGGLAFNPGVGSGTVKCLNKDELKYGEFNCQKALDYIDAQVTLETCPIIDNTPTIIGWAGIKTNDKWTWSADASDSLQYKLDSILSQKNSEMEDKNSRIGCVSIQETNNAQTVNPNINVVNKFQIQYIRLNGEITTHEITHTVDMNFNTTITLDGIEI